MEHHDPHLNILLDIQKQLGVLGAETARQSEMLISIDKQAKLTNGRVTNLEKDNQSHKEFRANLKGKVAVISVVLGFAVNLIIDWAKKNI